MTVEITTGRGRYRLALAGPPKVVRNAGEGLTLALHFERDDGMERVGLLCTIAAEIAGTVDTSDIDALLTLIAPWFEREFEQMREAALKSLRTEGRPYMVRFEAKSPGPFTA